MKISFDEAFNLLKECAAVILSGEGDKPVIYPSTCEPDGNDGEFLYLEWNDDRGYEYSIKARLEENQQCEWNIPGLTLVDTEGDPFDMTILVPMH